MASLKKKLALKTLDLHGKTVGEVFDLVDQFITKNQNQSRVRIMPGVGTGKVKAELLRYLKLGGYPYELEVMESGNKNQGSFIIILE